MWYSRIYGTRNYFKYGLWTFCRLVGYGSTFAFADETPMKIYENILEGRIKFTSDFDETSKSLIKHLLDRDVSRRYGNLKNGVEDIKNHPFFRSMDWDKLLKQEIVADFIPKIKPENELKYFDFYPESDEKMEPIPSKDDVFLKEFN